MADAELLIECESLADRLGEADLRIVDCRFDLADPQAGHAQYLQGHIPGAVFADLDRDLSAPVAPGTGRHPLPDPDVFAHTLGLLGIGSDHAVVCYDQASGALAARLWWMLRWAGHDDTCLLNGGMDRWRAIGESLESGAAKYEPARFQPVVRTELILGSREIVETGASDLLLVDARDTARFSGRVEPLDVVAGHIPGSTNVPFASSLLDDGRWKDAKALRRLWQESLADGYGKAWSVMCGSGVTACHLAVSGLLAGLPEPRVYVGSWSEWITDSSRPVRTGT